MTRPPGPHSLPIWSEAGVQAVERTVERRGRADPPAPGAAERDFVVTEEPLELRVGGETLMVTMRTPGDDLDLAAGLLFTEGVISSLDQIAALRQGGGAGRDRQNVVEVVAAPARTSAATTPSTR